MSQIQDPIGYAEFIAKYEGCKYRLVVENAARALNHHAQQVSGLVEGLMDFAHRMGVEFTVSQVSVWFDSMHDQQYVRTQMGAARVFIYYLPELRSLGVVEKIQ